MRHETQEHNYCRLHNAIHKELRSNRQFTELVDSVMILEQRQYK